jgi:hypothetical protein
MGLISMDMNIIQRERVVVVEMVVTKFPPPKETHEKF